MEYWRAFLLGKLVCSSRERKQIGIEPINLNKFASLSPDADSDQITHARVEFRVCIVMSGGQHEVRAIAAVVQF